MSEYTCLGCGDQISVPNNSVFPINCHRCGLSRWQSNSGFAPTDHGVGTVYNPFVGHTRPYQMRIAELEAEIERLRADNATLRAHRKAGRVLAAKLEEYLLTGGLFNPELMAPMVVRDMIMECRDHLRGEKP